MSEFSGKCDLRDHIEGLAGWYDRNGNKVKLGDPNVGAYYGNELEDFLEFKRLTGGVIHQQKRVLVTELNQDFIEKHCGFFKVIKHTENRPDKRTKSGFKEYTYYTYQYFGEDYTLDQINKYGGALITKDIHFDTLLDLAPYYPYVISLSACDKDSHTVYISDKPWPEEEADRWLSSGYESNLVDYYRKKLTAHIREITLKYYLEDYDERANQSRKEI